MNTRWTDKVDKNMPLPEYPRPQLRREPWLNLNGQWDYAISTSEERPEQFQGKITVPFSPETALSGVGKTLKPGEFLWYRREILLPETFVGKRLILHFGAIDQRAKVWVNSKEAAEHKGGYLSFEVDITQMLCGNRAEIAVRVTDETDSGSQTRGKQKTKRGGIWYTPQSGIWQTVWLEAAPEDYVKKLRITPNIDTGTVEISAELVGKGEARAEFRGKSYPLPATIPVENFEEWSPENPKLYDFSVVYGEDRAESYFAMRKFSVGSDENGIKRLFLNNRPYFHNGLLDQGYWPDGLYTAPTDEAMIFDIETAKAMGFNMLRKHIKVEPLRWYYHCDRLGMLVWQDMPNGGGKYDPVIISAPLVTGIHLKDSNYKGFAREDAEGRRQYEEELRGMIEQLYNCPCIAMWVPFNEGWGQFDAARMHDMVHKLDGTRTVDHASGWHDQKCGEVRSEHVYFRRYRFKPDRLGRAALLSEFGGYNHYVEGHSFNTKNFGYRNFKTAEDLQNALRELYQGQIAPAVNRGLAAAVYTQLSDVEDELNGMMTYDRKVVKIPKEEMKKIINVENEKPCEKKQKIT